MNLWENCFLTLFFTPIGGEILSLGYIFFCKINLVFDTNKMRYHTWRSEEIDFFAPRVFYPFRGLNIEFRVHFCVQDHSSHQYEQNEVSYIKIRGNYFLHIIAAILNFEKAKRLGTSQSTEILSIDLDLSFSAKKIKVYVATRLDENSTRES